MSQQYNQDYLRYQGAQYSQSNPDLDQNSQEAFVMRVRSQIQQRLQQQQQQRSQESPYRSQPFDSQPEQRIMTQQTPQNYRYGTLAAAPHQELSSQPVQRFQGDASAANSNIVDLTHAQPLSSHFQESPDSLTGGQESFRRIEPNQMDYYGQEEEQSEEEQEEEEEEKERSVQINEGFEEVDPYHFQQIIDELVQENDQLKRQLSQTLKKQGKVEGQLEKTKAMLREVGMIRNDIMHLKQTAEEAEDMDRVTAENEILKCKISDMETKMNTMSQTESELHDIRSREKLEYERRIQDLQDEKQRTHNELVRIVESLRGLEQSLEQANTVIDIRENTIQNLEQQVKSLEQEKLALEEDHKQLKIRFTFLQNQVQSPVKNQRDVRNSQQMSNKSYVALRNRALSSEKKRQSESEEKARSGSFFEYQNMNRRDLSGSPQRENMNYYSNIGQVQNQQNDRMSLSYIPRESQPPPQHAVKITVSSPTQQNKALVDRCNRLEQYCRELVRTNKILDCENRLAISQLIHLTDGGSQLSNMISALNLISTSGKIYNTQKKLPLRPPEAKRNLRLPYQQKQFNTISYNKSIPQKPKAAQARSGSKSLKNLINLRSGGGVKQQSNLHLSQGRIQPEQQMQTIKQSIANQSFTVHSMGDGTQSLRIKAQARSSGKYQTLQQERSMIVYSDQEQQHQTFDRNQMPPGEVLQGHFVKY